MATNRRVFYVGLNMAGAISAGAYTAGVIDFFIDALDTLYEKRREQAARYGEDFSRWEIPAHEVRLVAFSGASAGGMTSAIAAATLCEAFTPVRSPMPARAPNRLYKSWVQDIDLSYLLQDQDLKAATAPVVSLLDSTQIDKIAADAVHVLNPLPQKRPYVSEGLKVILTLTNVGGVPYATESNDGNDETQTLYRADQADFEVRWDGTRAAGEALTLSPVSADNWDELAQAAKATGAFPIALAPRSLNRNTTMYNRREWRSSQADPQVVDGRCQCEYFAEMPPNWDYSDGIPFRTLNVDGGVTNNNPFECAHQELLKQEPTQSLGHNPRSGEQADRAVISIAPFLSTPTFDLQTPPSANLTALVGELIDTVVNQSRIQGENLKLTRDPTVFSRWAISPSIDDTTRNALASASLGAFGGFIAKEFRDHDYQLGRRNCQWFLKRHFGVPLNNVVVQDYGQTQNFEKQFGMTLLDGSSGIALIPLLGPLDPDTNPIPEVHVKIPQDRLQPIVDAAAKRLKLVASRLVTGGQGGWLKGIGFDALWLVVQGPLKRALSEKMGRDLARQNLIA